MEGNINGGAVNGANNDPAPQPQIPHDAAAAAAAAAAEIHEMATQLLAQGRLEEAFRHVLNTNNAGHTDWVCSQVDMEGVMSMDPFPLSVSVMRDLLNLLRSSLDVNSEQKIVWLTYIVSKIDVAHPQIGLYIRGYLILLQQDCSIPQPWSNNVPSIKVRVLLKVLESVLGSMR